MYMMVIVEMSVFNRVAGKFVKNLNKHSLPLAYFLDQRKIFLEQLGAVLVDHRTGASLIFVEFLTEHMHHMHTTRGPLIQTTFSCMHLHGYGPRERKEA